MDKKFKENLEKLVVEKAGKALKEQLDGLEGYITRNLQKAVARVLGFEHDSWGNEWKVDHCNGRQSVISNGLERLVHKIVDEKLAEIITPELVKQTIEESKSGIICEFRHHFEYAMKDAARKAATIKAEELSKDFVDKFCKLDFDNVEIDDPASGDTKLGEAILQIVVEQSKEKPNG